MELIFKYEWRLIMLIHLPPHSKKYNREILQDLYVSRKKIFIDRLSWNLKNDGLKEIDQFDHDQCHYLASVYNNEVIGGVRLTPSTAPNLTFDIFKDILKLPRSIERCPYLLESSRFGIEKTRELPVTNGLRQKTMELFEGMLKFALDYKYKKIITVTDIRIERILKLSNWPLERLTEVKEVGNTYSIIGLLDVCMDTYTKMREKRIKNFNSTLF